MSECAWSSLLEGDGECSAQKWLLLVALISAPCGLACCALAGFVWWRRRRARAAEAADPAAEGASDDETGTGQKAMEEWDPQPPDEADALPMLLCITSPQGQTACTGQYVLTLQEHRNGQPVWEKRGGGRWLYSGKDGRWYVGGYKARRRDFACSSGYLRCARAHHSAPPDWVGKWERRQLLRGWAADRAVSVAADLEDVPLGGVLPQVCTDANIKATMMKLGTKTIVEDARADAGGCAGVTFAAPWPAGADGMNDDASTDPTTATPMSSVAPSSQTEPSETNTDQGSFAALSNSKHSHVQPVAEMPRLTPSLGRYLAERDVDPPWARSLPHKKAPQAMRVHVPYGQRQCTGIYELVPDEKPNGQPLWKLRDGNLWLYYSQSGRWCIGGDDVRNEQFKRTAGFISQTSVETDVLPHECTTIWQRWTGNMFLEDDHIIVAKLHQSDSEVAWGQLKLGEKAKGQAPGGRQLPVSLPLAKGDAAGQPAANGQEQFSRKGGRRTPPPSPAVTPFNSPQLSPRSSPLNSPRGGKESRGLNLADMVLECVRVVGVDISTIPKAQRCLEKALAAGAPLRVGPRLQPQLFAKAAKAGRSLPQDCIFELVWAPPGLHLRRATPGVSILVDGDPMQEEERILPKSVEVTVCVPGSESPWLCYRIACSPSSGSGPVPPLLRVRSPNKQSACSGDYTLVPRMAPNNEPVWAKRIGGKWIYSGVDGRWYIGGKTARSLDFRCSTGHIYQGEPHMGKLPHELSGPWAWAEGGAWHNDADVTVTAVWPAMEVDSAEEFEGFCV